MAGTVLVEEMQQSLPASKTPQKTMNFTNVWEQGLEAELPIRNSTPDSHCIRPSYISA